MPGERSQVRDSATCKACHRFFWYWRPMDPKTGKATGRIQVCCSRECALVLGQRAQSVPDSEYERIAEMYERQHRSTTSIAKLYNVSCSTVQNILKRCSVVLRQRRIPFCRECGKPAKQEGLCAKHYLVYRSALLRDWRDKNARKERTA
jgi:hypothetical protein